MDGWKRGGWIDTYLLLATINRRGRSKTPFIGSSEWTPVLRMKGKKYKRSQHAVKNIYEKYFGIRRPYQVLVDAEFCVESLKKKIAPAEAMVEVFGGPVKLMTTPCIMNELRRQDKQESSGATFVARRFELRNCRHEDRKMSGADCLKDLIGKNNPHHYCVAGQDAALRQAIRQVYGVPTIFILRDTVLMEPPTEKTLAVVKRKEEQKLLMPARDDIKRIKKREAGPVEPVPAIESVSNAEKPKKKTKKKKSKGGPNPLSCKKKTQTEKLKQKQDEASVVKAKKKPRKRRPKKAKTVTE